MAEKKVKIEDIGTVEKDTKKKEATGKKGDPIPIKDRGEAISNKTYIMEE